MEATIYHPSQFLHENEIYDVGEHCPICRKKAAHKQSVIIQKNPDIFLFQCQNCKGFYASKLPHKQTLDAYYAKYYLTNDLKVTFYSPPKFACHLLKQMNLEHFNKSKILIIDFGGGGGAISRALAEAILNQYPTIKEAKVCVIDYQTFENYSDANIEVESKKNLSEISGSHDIVLASAVLEHIPNMHEVITKLFSTVGRGGYFYARTPYVEPFMKLSRKVEMTYPAHIHDLGASFWNRVIQTFDLNAEIVKSSPSIAETSFKQSFSRALISRLLKFPGQIECMIYKNKKHMFWKYTGGWEVFLKF